jgi:hypothetical protein
MKKPHLKIVAKLWIASLAVNSEMVFHAEEAGLTEMELSTVVKEAVLIGEKMAGKHGIKPTLTDIVSHVYNTYYKS